MWVEHPVRYASMFSVPGFAPYAVPPNRLLNMEGAGVWVYNAFDLKNTFMGVNWTNHRVPNHSQGVGLAARIQPNGDCYFAAIEWGIFSGGAKGVSIYRYASATDSITLLASNTVITGDGTVPFVLGDPFGLSFLVLENNLFARIHDVDFNGTIFIEATALDGVISDAGNIGVCGSMRPPSPSFQGMNHIFFDELEVRDMAV